MTVSRIVERLPGECMAIYQLLIEGADGKEKLHFMARRYRNDAVGRFDPFNLGAVLDEILDHDTGTLLFYSVFFSEGNWFLSELVRVNLHHVKAVNMQVKTLEKPIAGEEARA